MNKDTMENRVRVLAFSGSLRTASWNRKALQLAKRFAAGAGADVVEIDLRELNLPIYDQDIENKGLPESVLRLKAAVESADVLLIASPEYNYGVSGALKNALDWASRQGNSWSGKWAAIFGASDGIVGTLRGQFQLRHILTSLNVFVAPQPQVFFRKAQELFDSSGSLNDQKLNDQLRKLVVQTIETAGKLKPSAD